MTKLVMDKVQFLKAVQTLSQDGGKVDLADVIGVAQNCNTWLIDAAEDAVKEVSSRSQMRRIEIQLGEE